MPDGYKYHFFISYPRSGDVPEWLQNHFLPVLRNRLDAEMAEEVQIFCDENLETGVDWPDAIIAALHQSRYLVPIWTPKYFQSKWCLAEFHTMRLREEVAGFRTQENPNGLILPVLFSDGDKLPDDAQRIQTRYDLRDFAIPEPVFKNSLRYIDFRDEISKLATDLDSMLPRVPHWDSSWEIVKPDPEPPFAPKFSRL